MIYRNYFCLFLFSLLGISNIWHHAYTNYSAYMCYLVSLNFWGLNSIMFIACYMLFSLNSFRGVVVFQVLILLSVFNLYEKNDYILVSSPLPTLLVGTITIHPLLFYISLVFLFLFFQSYHSILSLNLTGRFMLATLSLALSLGGLWGLQSNAWGYLWANDGIEWILVFIILSTLKFSHAYRLQRTLLYANIVAIFQINGLLLIRLNILTTRHSFLSRYSLAYALGYLYYYLICLLNFVPKKLSLIWDVTLLKHLQLVLFFIGLSFKINSCILKFFFYESISFFLYRGFQIIQKNIDSVLHFVLGIFIFLWQILFFYFFIYFNSSPLVSIQAIWYGAQTQVGARLYLIIFEKKILLEEVFFLISNFVGTDFRDYSMDTSLLVLFNNMGLVFLIYCVVFSILLKLFEFRFLYKKKTYI